MTFSLSILFFHGLCLWCRIQEILAESNVMKLLPYVLLQELYSFTTYIEVFDPF